MTYQTVRYKIYAAGKKEQLQHDIAMIRHAMDLSENYQEFKGRLSEQINNLDLELVQW